MTGPLPPMSRLVRCTKCHRVLPEPINIPVYRCGGCDTVLKAKICKNGTKDTDVHVPDTNMGNKKESEQDSEGNEAQNLSKEDREARSLSKEDREARSLSKEERLSSSGELPLDKNNGSDEKENEDSNMNQSGITHHGYDCLCDGFRGCFASVLARKRAPSNRPLSPPPLIKLMLRDMPETLWKLPKNFNSILLVWGAMISPQRQKLFKRR